METPNLLRISLSSLEALSRVTGVCDFQLHYHSNMIRSGFDVPGGQTGWPPVVGGSNILPGGLLFGGRGLTDRSAARVGGEIAGKQHAPTAGIREVVSGDRDASALPEVQHMKLMLLSR